MSENTFQECKTGKYKHTIPSRECILKHFIKSKKNFHYKEIASLLNVRGVAQTKALCHRLRAMEKDGQLIFTRRGQYYALPERFNLLRGIVIGHRNGYGFLRVEGRKKDLYLSSKQMKTCIHGDQVLAQQLNVNHNGRYEARIIRILVPKIIQIIGRYFIKAGIGFVVPDDSRFNFDILIPPEEVMGARAGFIVVVELIKRLTHNTKAIGKIIEVLGDITNTNMAVILALRTHAIPYTWPKDVEEQIEDLKIKMPKRARINRIDLRKLPFITIDDEDTRDFDDAIYCEKKYNGSWRLWVAVADVSYYVRPHTPLDKEAYNRGTSIYFPSKTILMLPELLSNDLCSLKPQVDRLCMICEMTISSNGYLTGYEFYEAIINSHACFTYTKVWHILQGDLELNKQYISLVKHIKELYNLYKILKNAREIRGSIVIDNEEAKFVFNGEYRIQYIKHIKRNDVHKLIEECMILANIAAAYFVEQSNEPALFRIHEKPTEEAIVTFRSILTELGLELSGGISPKTRDFAKLLTFIANRPDAEMLRSMLMRSMNQAIYASENRGHFGLALQSYAHFTSPIRRYPDLLLHRTIKYILSKKKYSFIKNKKTGGYRYSIEEIFSFGKHCSMTERRADDAERKVIDWLKCDFMLDQVGNSFQGVIVNVTGFGFFVRISELFIDGLVHITSLNDDNYYFDQSKQRLIGVNENNIYSLGNHVEVRVKAVNIDERKICLTLISNN